MRHNLAVIAKLSGNTLPYFTQQFEIITHKAHFGIDLLIDIMILSTS